MLMKDVSTPFETRKIIHYSQTEMNKAVRHNFQMQYMGDNLYKGEMNTDEYGRMSCDIFAVYPEAPCGILLWYNTTIYEDRTVEYYLEEARREGIDTYDNFVSLLRRRMEKGVFVGNMEIALVAQTDQDLAKELAAHREACIAKREEKHEAERKRREEEDRAYVEEQNAISQNVIIAATATIRNGGCLKNTDITVYRDRYDSSTYKIINYLARQYGVKIPLRTQGWINDNLTEITIQNGHMTEYRFWKPKGSSGSTVIFKYMNQLIEAVNKISNAG